MEQDTKVVDSTPQGNDNTAEVGRSEEAMLADIISNSDIMNYNNDDSTQEVPKPEDHSEEAEQEVEDLADEEST